MTNEEFIESIRLEGEEWRPVVGWEDRYMVSSFGRAVSLEKTYTCCNGLPNRSIRKILKGWKKHCHSNIDYICFSFFRGGKRIITPLHRMVALAFIPNPNNYPCVDHIDGNTLNNKADNLRWCTVQMNNNNPVTYKRYRKAMFARRGIPNTKIAQPVVQLDMQGNYIKTYRSMSDAKNDGFLKGNISATCLGKKPQYKGYKWMKLSDYELLINKSKNPNGSERQLSLPL